MHTHSMRNPGSTGIALLLALCALFASCASTHDAGRMRRGTMVSVPDTVAVEHFKQGIGDLIGRVVLLGLSRTGNCKIYDGGILRVISERPGPGGEVKVAYYHANVPASRHDQCDDGTILEVLDSDLRFYQAFFDLKQKAIESIRASVAGIDSASAAEVDSVNVNETWVSRGDFTILRDESIVTVASPGTESSSDSMFVQTGGDCRICALAPDGESGPGTAAGSAAPAPPYKIVKGFLPYVDPRTGKTATAVVWDYFANASLSTRAGKQECPTGTRFLEPDIIAGTMKEMHEMFLRHNLSDMQRIVSGLEGGLAAYPVRADADSVSVRPDTTR